jgi:hypothetical protein
LPLIEGDCALVVIHFPGWVPFKKARSPLRDKAGAISHNPFLDQDGRIEASVGNPAGLPACHAVSMSAPTPLRVPQKTSRQKLLLTVKRNVVSCFLLLIV